jgi:phage portal protein BeeE
MKEAQPADLPPTAASMSPDIARIAEEAAAILFDKFQTHGEAMTKGLVASQAPVPTPPTGPEQPKSWFNDPFALLDSLGMGYRTAPSMLTYDTLRAVSEKDTIVAAIIGTRVNQVAAFCRPQENKYSVGFAIRLRDHKRRPGRLTDSERERCGEIEHFILNTGRDYNLGRDSFEQFMRKLVRDRLAYDQATFEKVRTYGQRMHSFHAVPADTIRIAQPKVIKGTPPEIADIKRALKYVQVLNGQIVTEFTLDEMAFMVANPRTNVRSFGYGFPEIEILINTITSHMWAEEWNRRAFSQGSTVKGVLNVRGNIPANQLEAFKRTWMLQTSGVSNAWKTPVLNTEGLEWMPMQMTNVEMGYQTWMDYLVKITSAIYQIDPAEINFDIRGGGGTQQPMFMSNNEAQQKVSKDRGLHPLLRYVEDHINKHIVWQIDPRFEFAFVGLDAKTEEQETQLRMQQVQNIYTLNEVRAREDLPPLKHGDIVLNPTYTGAMAQAQAQEQQQQGGGGMPGMPGGGGDPQGGGDEPPKPEHKGEGAYAAPFGGKGAADKEGGEKLRQFDEREAYQQRRPAPADTRSEETKRYSPISESSASYDDISKAFTTDDETYFAVVDL